MPTEDDMKNLEMAMRWGKLREKLRRELSQYDLETFEYHNKKFADNTMMLLKLKGGYHV